MGKQVVYPLGDYYSLPYSDSTCVKMKRYLETYQDKIYSPSDATDLTPEEVNQLNYLTLSIEAFYAQKNKFHTKRKDLIPLIMDFDGAKKLKRQRLKSFLTTHNSKLIETPEWWNDTKSIFLEDIGEVYNYNYCMFWSAPDEQDYLLSQLPVNVDEEMKQDFIAFINDKISRCEDFQEIKSEEILFRVSSSKALYKGQSVPHYSEKSNRMTFSSKRKPGKRVLITTGPGSGRDAILNEIDDLNTIQLINENVRSFLEENYSRFLLLGNAERAKNKYFKRCSKSKGFYCRDIKKEGITKPKWILKELLKALHNRYSENMAFHFPEFFDGPWFEGDKGHRGHGLGMANELTTLMQIMLFLYTNKVLGDEGEYVIATKAFFLNDDAVVFFDEEEQEWGDPLETFVDIDFHVCQSLGVMAQKDKSFISKDCCVFCEMYYSRKYRTMNDKESYFLRELSIILRSGSILEAKFLLGNMKGSLSQIENMLLSAYSRLGYEFSHKEVNWPISVGGCRPTKLRGTDLALLTIEEEKNLKPIFNAYLANKHRRLWKYDKLIKNFVPPILKFYPSLRNQDETLLEKMGICSDFQYSCMFFRPTKERKFHRSIEKLGRKREKVFKEQINPPSQEDFYTMICTESLSNMKVPDRFIERYIDVEIFIFKNFKDPYTIKNPITSFLNFIGLKKEDDIPKTTWGLFNTDASLLNEKSVFARSRTLNTLSLIDRFEEDIETDFLVFPKNKEDIPIFMEAYPKPFLTSELIVNGNKLPIPKQKFWNKDLWRRREVYGRYLEKHHIILAQTYTWRELKYIIEFERREPDFEYSVDFWHEVFRTLKQKQLEQEKGNIKYSSSSSDNDDDNPFKDLIPVYKPGDVLILLSDLDKKLGSKSSESEESEPEKEEENVPKNIFLIESGELPDGDISVYASKGWVEWLVQQDELSIEEYTELDEDLKFACTDMLMFKRKISTTSNIMEEHNKDLHSMLESSKKWSWISLYFYNYIHTTEEDEPQNDYDLFS